MTDSARRLCHEIELVENANAHVVPHVQGFPDELLIRRDRDVEEAICDLMAYAAHVHMLDA
jgi:hypothetical protein